MNCGDSNMQCVCFCFFWYGSVCKESCCQQFSFF